MKQNMSKYISFALGVVESLHFISESVFNRSKIDLDIRNLNQVQRLRRCYGA